MLITIIINSAEPSPQDAAVLAALSGKLIAQGQPASSFIAPTQKDISDIVKTKSAVIANSPGALALPPTASAPAIPQDAYLAGITSHSIDPADNPSSGAPDDMDKIADFGFGIAPPPAAIAATVTAPPPPARTPEQMIADHAASVGIAPPPPNTAPAAPAAPAQSTAPSAAGHAIPTHNAQGLPLDAKGTPHDTRIHAKPPTINSSDGEWRKKRGVDMDLHEKVSNELRIISISGGTLPDTAAPGKVKTTHTPAEPTAPTEPSMFAKLMQHIAPYMVGCSDYGKMTDGDVTACCKAIGVIDATGNGSVAALAQREDKIGDFVQAFNARWTELNPAA